MSASNFDLIFEEWEANLKTKDRSAGAVSSNFEELFDALKAAGANFDEARALLPKATKAHQPAPALARNTYKNAKSSPKVSGFSEKEFIDQWNKDIADKATGAFYSVFPRPKAKNEDDDGEPKVYGSMSVKEYKAQRRHADAYPILDTEELEKKMMQGTYNPIEDIASILDKKKDSNGSDT